MNVSLRKMTAYHTDDGRRIEVFEKVAEIPLDLPPHERENIAEVEKKLTETPAVESPRQFIGMIVVNTPMGNRPVRFDIPEAASVEDAFAKFYQYGDPKAKEVMEAAVDYAKKFEAEQAKRFANEKNTEPAPK
jgi:hypothetical protein